MNPVVDFRLSQNVLENLTTAVLLLDKTRKLVYINTAGEMIFAESSRQLLGSSAKDLFRGCEGVIEEDLVRCLDTGASLSERNIVLEMLEHPVTVNFFVTPLYEGTKPANILVEMHQVDRHLRIYREEQLLEQQHASRLLLRGLAHEIKNPLGGLRGAAQLLDQELDSAELREYTKIVIEEADRLRVLVDRMLGPKRLPQKRSLNIHKVVERVRQLVQAEAPENVKIEQDYDPSIPELYADSDQLIQAVLNIVLNAAQAVGDEGRITLRTRIDRRMTIGHQQNKLVIKLDVIDTGVGIEPEMLSQIFYPMVTSRAEGTGLGLSIAQSIINRHGGLVECISSPGRTVFSIFLPLEFGDE